ncbi:lactonase family protein [Salinibacterium sp. SYSU T00001]|uniref:lactonase family protein n=1 Tax=Homoserinimonas sedimenticola TaxID=2986805 RepID=UPI0022366C0F|nr:lactonase family protein [Salinibacterium sedimenticola]MCW4384563.1 lactonase family protein [Salinibacterium sedimenticola]
MVRSPDLLLWAGGYSSGMGGAAEGIGLLRWDGASLSFEGTVARMPSPSFLAYDRGVVAAVDEETGHVRTFAASPDGGLVPLGGGGAVPTSGPNPCHVRFLDGSEARALLVANYGSGSIDLVECGADGAAHNLASSFQGAGSGPRDEQDGPHAHSTAVVTRGSRAPWVVSADLGADLVHLLSLSSGVLSPVSSLSVPPGTGPRDLLALRERMVLLGEFGGALCELGMDEAGLELVASGQIAEGAEGDQASGLVAGRDARFLYAGLRGSNRIAVADAASLAPVGTVSCEGDWPRHLALVGDALFVSNQRSGSVAVFALDADTGMPEFLTSANVPTPTFLLPAASAY